jgi:hypothetical protein
MRRPDSTISNKLQNDLQDLRIGQVEDVAVLYVDATRNAQPQFSDRSRQSPTSTQDFQKGARNAPRAASRLDGRATRGTSKSAWQCTLDLGHDANEAGGRVARRPGDSPAAASVRMPCVETIGIPWTFIFMTSRLRNAGLPCQVTVLRRSGAPQLRDRQRDGGSKVPMGQATSAGGTAASGATKPPVLLRGPSHHRAKRKLAVEREA